MKPIILKGLSIGNFAADLTLESSEEVFDFFAQWGAKAYFAGKPVNKWEREEATRLGLWPVNASGTAERPKTYKRESLPFGQESATALEKIFRLATVPVGGKAVDCGVSDVSVTENSDYTGVIAFLNGWLATPNKKDGSKRTIEGFCESRGLTLPSEPFEEDNAFLASVATWLASQD